MLTAEPDIRAAIAGAIDRLAAAGALPLALASLQALEQPIPALPPPPPGLGEPPPTLWLHFGAWAELTWIAWATYARALAAAGTNQAAIAAALASRQGWHPAYLPRLLPCTSNAPARS